MQVQLISVRAAGTKESLVHPAVSSKSSSPLSSKYHLSPTPLVYFSFINVLLFYSPRPCLLVPPGCHIVYSNHLNDASIFIDRDILHVIKISLVQPWAEKYDAMNCHEDHIKFSPLRVPFTCKRTSLVIADICYIYFCLYAILIISKTLESSHLQQINYI